MQLAYKGLAVWKRVVNFAVAVIDTVEGDFNKPDYPPSPSALSFHL